MRQNVLDRALRLRSALSDSTPELRLGSATEIAGTQLPHRGAADVTPRGSRTLQSVARTLPTGVITAIALLLAWNAHGSISASDWLPYALASGSVLGVVLLSGEAVRLERRNLAGAVLLFGFAAWVGLSAAWSSSPSRARDEALLVALYGAVFLVPLLTLRKKAEGRLALSFLVAGLGLSAFAIAVQLARTTDPLSLFDVGRLAYPVTYANGQAAMLILGFWPAVLLAARRCSPILVRGAWVATATLLLGVALLAQSKGATIALIASAVLLFSISPERLRMLVPTLMAGGLVGSQFSPLTAPFPAKGDAALQEAVRAGGAAVLRVSAVAFAVGLVYAFVDRRLTFTPRTRRILGVLAILAVAGSLVGGAFAFARSVSEPSHFLQRQWHAFREPPGKRDRSTHLLSLGSNRYDFWRAATAEFAAHPLAGIGAWSFRFAYLREGRSSETPARVHSLPLEVLSEDGIVGFLLLGGAITLIVGGVLRSRTPTNVALGAAAIFWLIHSAVDWIWTLPALGVPFFLLLGIAARSHLVATPVRKRSSLILGIGSLLASALLFIPPWLSARYVDGAPTSGNPSRNLRWASRLDALSVEPYIAQSRLAATPAAAIGPLEHALRIEPRSPTLHYLVGLAYLDAGRPAAAARSLRIAARLFPNDPVAEDALRRARKAAEK